MFKQLHSFYLQFATDIQRAFLSFSSPLHHYLSFEGDAYLESKTNEYLDALTEGEKKHKKKKDEEDSEEDDSEEEEDKETE